MPQITFLIILVCYTALNAGAVCNVMIYISTIINAIPPGTRDLVEFGFFMAVGVTAGSLGII